METNKQAYILDRYTPTKNIYTITNFLKNSSIF